MLVTDGEQRCALAACRALAEAGYEVGVASASAPAVAKWSRHCTRRISVPDPRREAGGFADVLRRELEQRHYDVILAGGDASLLALSAQRNELVPLVRLGLPAHDVVQACLDKGLLDQHARDVGFPRPITFSCTTTADGWSAAAELGYPVVVKPARSFSVAHATEHKPVVVEGGRALAAAVEQVGSPYLVQQLLADAPVISCAGVAVEGRVLGFVTSRYARVWPPARGSAACSETFRPSGALRAAIGELVGSLGWRGVFEIELLERGDGEAPVVIDFNTRLYGTLALAVRAGCNLPAIWCRYLIQRDLVDAEAAPGVSYRWEDGELFSLVRALVRGERRTAGAIFHGRRDVVWAHYQAGDARPLLARAIFLGRRGIETAASPPAAVRGRLDALTGGQR